MSNGIKLSGNTISIDAWQEREHGLPRIAQSWITRHNAERHESRRYVDGQNDEAFKWQRAIDHGHATPDEIYDYHQWMAGRKTWKVNNYTATSEAAVSDLRLIGRLLSAGLNRYVDSYQRAAQALLAAGYDQADIDSLPLLTVEQYKQRQTDLSPLRSINEWMLADEITEYETTTGDRLLTARAIVSRLAADADLITQSNIEHILKTQVAPYTHRLDYPDDGESIATLYKATKLYSLRTIQIEDLRQRAATAEAAAVQPYANYIGKVYERQRHGKSERRTVARVRCWLAHQPDSLLFEDGAGNAISGMVPGSQYSEWSEVES